jgi:integrase
MGGGGIHRLSSRDVANAKADGMYHDGGGLYLQVSSGGKARSWLYRYAKDGRERSMGLGPLLVVSLADAREQADKYRRLRLDGIDPIEARKTERLDRKQAEAKRIPFRHCAEEWMKVQVGWSRGYREAAEGRFEQFAYPKIGDVPIERFDLNRSREAVSLIHDVLNPIWVRKQTTAEMLRQYIQGALGWAYASGLIGNMGAADLDGPLGHLLPKKETFYKVKHHRSMPAGEVGAFVKMLRSRADETRHSLRIRRPVACEMMEFLILTAVRKDQAIMARWSEFDLSPAAGHGIWSCEHHKTAKKTGEAHIIPLSRQARAILDRMQAIQKERGLKSEFVFPGGRNAARGHMSKTAVNAFLHRGLKRPDVSIHGFRTTFKEWAVETQQDETHSEMVLAHVVGNQVRNVYARNAKAIEPRRLILQAWADYCDRTEPIGASGNVVGIHSKRRRAAT